MDHSSRIWALALRRLHSNISKAPPLLHSSPHQHQAQSDLIGSWSGKAIWREWTLDVGDIRDWVRVRDGIGQDVGRALVHVLCLVGQGRLAEQDAEHLQPDGTPDPVGRCRTTEDHRFQEAQDKRNIGWGGGTAAKSSK